MDIERVAPLERDLTAYLDLLTARLRTQLGDALVAAWVIGSGALGDFDPLRSDIDASRPSAPPGWTDGRWNAWPQPSRTTRFRARSVASNRPLRAAVDRSRRAWRILATSNEHAQALASAPPTRRINETAWPLLLATSARAFEPLRRAASAAQVPVR